MKIAIITARAKNNIIGKSDRLPWHLPEDMQYFKAKTAGHFVLMGRKTYESIGKKLPDRKVIIATKDRSFQADDCIVVNTIEAGIAHARQQGETELFIAGGASIYAQTLLLADQIYMTEVEQEFEGNAYFPDLDPTIWRICNRETLPPEGDRSFPLTFTFYEKRSNLPKCSA